MEKSKTLNEKYVVNLVFQSVRFNKEEERL